MTSDEYAQILDDFELNAPGDVMPGESLTEYIERRRREFESKADGGSIGIEVLFGPKVPAAPSQLVSESDILLGYRGDAAYRSGSEQSKSIGQGNVGTKSDFGDGPARGGGDNRRDDKPIKILPPFKLPEGGPVIVDSVSETLTKEKLPAGVLEQFYKMNAMLTDPETGKSIKHLTVETPTDYTFRRVTPDGIMENDIAQPFGAPQSLSVDPYSNNIIGSDLRADLTKSQKKALGKQKMGYDMGIFSIDDVRENIKPLGDPDNPATNEEIKEFFQAKDGGRVGLFMGGPALEGQALAIYNSMNVTGATDQEIADRLQSLGLYTPGATTTPPPTTPSQPSGYIGRDDNDGPSIVDMTDYSFNKKNYAPGKKLEVNPAAFGISFEKASKPQGIINAALDMPGRTLTSFASPTTGGNITGPAEEGFMSQVVDIDPAGRTREELRQLYDNYNRFFGAPSNFAAARTPGKAGQVFGTIVGAAAGIPFLGPGIDALSKLGSGGDKSLQTKYGVEGGFGGGNTKFRDEFGVSVVDDNKRIFGKKDRDYLDRMEERLGQLEGFFGSRIEGFDINNLTPDMLTDMRRINSFYTKQVQAYLDRIEVEKINEAQKQKEEADALQARIDAERAAGAAANQAMQRREGRGGDHMSRSRAQGGLGISKSAAQAISDANRKAGMGGYGLKDGGLATMFTRRR